MMKKGNWELLLKRNREYSNFYKNCDVAKCIREAKGEQIEALESIHTDEFVDELGDLMRSLANLSNKIEDTIGEVADVFADKILPDSLERGLMQIGGKLDQMEVSLDQDILLYELSYELTSLIGEIISIVESGLNLPPGSVIEKNFLKMKKRKKSIWEEKKITLEQEKQDWNVHKKANKRDEKRDVS